MTQFEKEFLEANLEFDISIYSLKSVMLSSAGKDTFDRLDNEWLLMTYLDYIINYDLLNTIYNLLSADQMNNILSHCEKLLHKNYNVQF